MAGFDGGCLKTGSRPSSQEGITKQVLTGDNSDTKESQCYEFQGRTPPRPDQLGLRSGYEPQDLRQLEEEKKKIFQCR